MSPPAQENAPGEPQGAHSNVIHHDDTPQDNNPVNEARPIRRGRATKIEMIERESALIALAEEHGPCSVRHIFYRAVVSGVVGITKDQAGYNKVQRSVLGLRRSGLVPYSHIVDNTRWRTQATVWDSPQDLLNHVASTYRRDLWSSSDYRVEVWVESDSIAGTIAGITNKWAVPLFVCRGQSSETFAYSAAADWNLSDQEPTVLYVGDHDPAGLEIENSLVDKLARFSDHDFTFERVAVNWDQVEACDLPGTKPKKLYGYPLAVEAEALPPQQLVSIVDEAISEYVDQDQLRTLKAAEESERDIFMRLATGLAS